MGVQTKDRVINDSKYEVTQFTARRALRLQARLLRVAGPAVGKVANARGLDESLDLGAIVSELVDRLDEKEVESLVMDLLSCTRRDGIELTAEAFDLAFAGNLFEVVKVIGFVLQVNYGDFIEALTGGQGSLFSPSPASPPKSSKG